MVHLKFTYSRGWLIGQNDMGMKITCVQYLYTFYGVLGKREKYTQKNSSVALRHRDMIIVDRHVLDSTTVTLCYLYLPVFYVYLPVLSCVHEKRAALFTPQSCVWGGRSLLPPCQTCPSVI